MSREGEKEAEEQRNAEQRSNEQRGEERMIKKERRTVVQIVERSREVEI